MEVANYQYSLGVHRGKKVIFIKFKYDKILIKNLRERFPSAKWSQSNKAWYLPDLKTIRQVLQIPQREWGEKLFPKINPINQKPLQDLIDQLKLKAYSPNTIKVYVSEFAKFLILVKNTPIENFTPNRLRDYFLYCVQHEKLKEQQLNSRINAIKFYFEQVKHQPKMFYDIPRPKKASKLPRVLSQNEVKKLFLQTNNSKHLLLLKLCYGMGLRVSELVNLKIEHIDSQSMRVLIEGAKGKKDRYTNLPESTLQLLREYYLKYRPKLWLFEGQYGLQYSIRSAQNVFKNALKKAEINKTVGIHGLRHSYATHLIEQGADIRFLKDLLGHHSIKTTQVYTHISDRSLSNIKSPLDAF